MASVLPGSQQAMDKEGFLCPICLRDMESASKLSNHFETAHSGDQPTDIVDQFKGLFGKAKKFFNIDAEEDGSLMSPGLYADLTDEPDGRKRSSSQRLSQVQLIPQEPGMKRSHTGWFKAIRDAQVDRSIIETNKLLIRMTKLTDDELPEEGPKRRAFEQKVVPWQNDHTVKTCSTCGKSFNLGRRRHHCRLCGGIICDRCSEFLPFSQAKILGSIASNPEISIGPKVFLQKRGSNSSLNSLGTADLGPALRICSSCRKLLETHKVKQEKRHFKPTILSLYEQLQEYRTKVDNMRPEYTKMAQSLRNGETTCSLPRAEALRSQISKLCSNMDVISKKIAALEADNGEQVSARQTKLQLSIRAYTAVHLQDLTFELPKLPDEKEFQQLLMQREEKRKRKVEREIQELQRKELSPTNIVNHTPPLSANTRSRPVTTMPSQDNAVPVKAEGWTPSDVESRHVVDDDPMVQQMNIIKGYLKQAKQAQRWDEVEMLEDNLRQLEEEFYRQSQ